ncbi:hypothetical protein BJX61DRAFT_532160 [Aspergillus egyptiacus]|nr:hypothetical protein BJX61DRAFT_532160 [Aspergillus egyptiacus]
MLSYTILPFVVSCVGLVTGAHPLKARQAPAIAHTFNIYAYGEDISGLPVFYADGKAQIGDPALSPADVAQPIFFTTDPTTPTTWLAHANTTEIQAADFDARVFTLASTAYSDGDGAVEFTKPADDTAAAAAGRPLTVYGNYVIIEEENANFYAIPTAVEGVYDLVWSSVGSEEIPVILRTMAPATMAVFGL